MYAFSFLGAPLLRGFSFFSFHSYLFRRPCVSVHLEGRIIFVLISVRLGVPMAAAILPAGLACTFFVKSRGYVLRDFCFFVIFRHLLSICNCFVTFLYLFFYFFFGIFLFRKDVLFDGSIFSFPIWSPSPILLLYFRVMEWLEVLFSEA